MSTDIAHEAPEATASETPDPAAEQSPEAEPSEDHHERDRLAFLDAIIEQAQEVQGLEEDWEAAKADAADAKKRYDAAVKKQRAFTLGVTPSTDVQEELPLTDSDEPVGSWRDVPLTEVLLNNKVVDAIAEVDVRTIGEFTKRVEECGLRGVTWWADINGIGQAKADNVDQEFIEWWEKNPELRDARAKEDAAAKGEE
jgi:hypothetical protein